MKKISFSLGATILVLFAVVACHKTTSNTGNYTCSCDRTQRMPPGVSPINDKYKEVYTNVTAETAKYRCNTLPDRYNSGSVTSRVYDCALE